MGIQPGLRVLMDGNPVVLENASVFIANASASVVYPQPYVEWRIRLGTSDHRSSDFTLDELREQQWPGFKLDTERDSKTVTRVSPERNT